jgi:uncharacterized protein YjbJ (UPF0337 family)
MLSLKKDQTETIVSSKGDESCTSISREFNEAFSQLFDEVSEAGETDLLRGYANETVGGAKLAVGRAIQSPELTLEGIAQATLGAIQRYVGEGKSESEKEEEAEASAIRQSLAQEGKV